MGEERSLWEAPAGPDMRDASYRGKWKNVTPGDGRQENTRRTCYLQTLVHAVYELQMPWHGVPMTGTPCLSSLSYKILKL